MPFELDDRITINTPEGIAVDIVIAGIGSRLSARLIDSLVQVAASLALFPIAALLNDSGGFLVAVAFLYTFVVIFLYDPLFEVFNQGRTPGKAATGIRVVDRDGRPVGFVPSAIRNVVRIADFLPTGYLAGFVAMMATQHAQRLGDMAAGTYVIRDRHAAEHEQVNLAAARATVPPAEVANWDVSGITPEEITMIRAFLARRTTLPAHARWQLGVDLAKLLAPKVTGIPSTSHPEYLLEGILVAKERRT